MCRKLLQQLTELDAGRIEFSLDSPPSLATLSARRALLAEAKPLLDTARRGRDTWEQIASLASGLTVVGVIALFVGAVAGIEDHLRELPFTVPAWMAGGGFSAALGGALLIMRGQLHTGPVSTVCRRLTEEAESLAPLERWRCKDLLALCAQYPEADAYRRRVVADGREFVAGEYSLLAQIPALVEESTACRRLYLLEE